MLQGEEDFSELATVRYRILQPFETLFLLSRFESKVNRKGKSVEKSENTLNTLSLQDITP